MSTVEDPRERSADDPRARSEPDPAEYPDVDPREYPLLRAHTWLAYGELFSAASALALFASMFLIRWYGAVGRAREPEGAGGSTAENAWHALVVSRWLMLVTIAFALASLALHATQRLRPKRTETAIPLTALAALTTLLLVFRVMIDPPASSAIVDVKLGAFVGLICSVGILLGAVEALRDERAVRTVRRGHEGKS